VIDACQMKPVQRALLLAVAIYSFALAGSYEAVNIAILDFDGAGVQENELSMVSDKFRTGFFETSKFRVMERASMEEILKEQGFQQTGTCNSNSCMIEAGKLLGVTYMLAGRVSRAGGITAITVRMIDVGTAEIVLAKTKEHRGSFEGFVTAEIPSFVTELSAAIMKALGAFAEKQKTGMLYVESNGENGAVTIDGVQTGQTTPATFREIDAGEHDLTIVTDTLVGRAHVVVAAGKLQKCTVTMETGYGTIRLQSGIPALVVDIPGRGSQTLPAQLDTVPAGEYSVTAERKGFAPYRRNVSVRALQTTDVVVEMTPVSFLHIDSINADSRVWVDNAELNNKSSAVLTVGPGTHRVRYIRSRYTGGNLFVRTVQGDTTKLVLRYSPLPATVGVVTVPPDALILLDMKPTGRTPSYLRMLAPGKHSLRLSSRTFLPIERELDLAPGTFTEVQDTFKIHTPEYVAWESRKDKVRFANLIFTGTGQIATGRNGGGCFMLCTGLLSDATLGLSSYKLYSHRRKEEAAQSQAESSYFQKRSRDDVAWVVCAGLSSVAFRLLSLAVTSHREYK